ncbi:MAG: 50S ribosomal protein L9 [Spirochaetes bacterium]|uniref:Large ribosomal subunit protein bL9 n=1 Tax=Candidatus Aphodenecus pullistercoris TaxID=2840669 RepID=A0A9D9HAY2_9SPIR|nr:50S ribosomal protein L9 [Candidatus Aphodenecus pullistercoris]
MKIILNQDVVNLGEEGDVVVVKDGYARNYLLPTGAAVLYNKTNAAIFASRAAQIEKRKAEKRAQSASMKEKLDATVLNLVVPAGESGKLFGSVTSTMVQEALSKLGLEVERKRIEVATHAIKMVGTYSVIVHLYENEFSTVKLVVESEEMVRERKAAEAKAEADAKAKAEAEAAAAAVAEAEAETEAPAEESAVEETASSEDAN